MTRHRSTYRLLTLLLTLLSASSLAVSAAEAQTSSRNGGTASRIRIGFSQQWSEAMGRQRAHELAEQRRFKGTQVKPDPKATGDTLTLQTQIAGLLSTQGFVPEPRKGHFRSMSENKNTPITSWDGTILNVTPEPDGMVVTVEIRARSVGGFCNSSTTVERYRFADGRLRFLDLVSKAGVSTWN